MKVGRAVEASMESRGVSQRWLAAASGIPLVTLNRSLKGHRSFNLNELGRVAEALDLSLVSLIAAADVEQVA